MVVGTIRISLVKPPKYCNKWHVLSRNGQIRVQLAHAVNMQRAIVVVVHEIISVSRIRSWTYRA